MGSRLLIYGANGDAGRRIAQRAVDKGMAPRLAGRDAAEIEAVAGSLGCDYRVFALDDPAFVDAGLAGADVVLNCAGPFRETARPLAEACLRTGVHYLDICGEWEAFAELLKLDEAAHERRLMLLPGVGFDVVPTDGLAAMLKRELPSATHLELALRFSDGVSRGTAQTLADKLGSGGAIRSAGHVKRQPLGSPRREIDFGDGPRPCMAMPWGDLVTAWRTTRIPNIIVYASLDPALQKMVRVARRVPWLGRTDTVREMFRRRLAPDEEHKGGEAVVWGEVRDGTGGSVRAALRTPEVHALTTTVAIASAARALHGETPAGFQTPSTAFGIDYALRFDDVVKEEVP